METRERWHQRQDEGVAERFGVADLIEVAFDRSTYLLCFALTSWRWCSHEVSTASESDEIVESVDTPIRPLGRLALRLKSAAGWTLFVLDMSLEFLEFCADRILQSLPQFSRKSEALINIASVSRPLPLERCRERIVSCLVWSAASMLWWLDQLELFTSVVVQRSPKEEDTDTLPMDLSHDPDIEHLSFFASIQTRIEKAARRLGWRVVYSLDFADWLMSSLLHRTARAMARGRRWFGRKDVADSLPEVL